MTSSFQALSIANMVLFGFTMAGVLVCVWIGWLRTRRVGFLVLAAWSLVSMAGMAASYLPIVQAWLGKPVSGRPTHELIMWINLLRSGVSSVLLLAGMGLLVFAEPQSRRAEHVQN